MSNINWFVWKRITRLHPHYPPIDKPGCLGEQALVLADPLENLYNTLFEFGFR